jgi:hypothetical protein
LPVFGDISIDTSATRGADVEPTRAVQDDVIFSSFYKSGRATPRD